MHIVHTNEELDHVVKGPKELDRLSCEQLKNYQDDNIRAHGGAYTGSDSFYEFLLPPTRELLWDF